MKYYKVFIVMTLIASVISFVIYKNINDNKVYFLAIGDELCKGKTPFGNYKNSYNDYLARYFDNNDTLEVYNPYFCEDNKNIKDIIKDIRNNNKFNIRIEEVGMATSIGKSDIITISVSNNEIFKKAETNNIYKVIDEKYEEMVELLTLIEKLTNADIYIVSHYIPIKDCKKREEIDEYIYKKFIALEKFKNANYIYINKGVLDKSHYIPDLKNPYPSEEGYNYIFNEIVHKIIENS